MSSADVLIGSLCSGVGGLDLGVQAALGGHIAWHTETDPHANQVLARHWQAPNLGDVQAIDWHRVRPVCVLTAGFPCQDLSVAGPRTGLAPGTRSGLWHHIVTSIETLNPCLVVIENVRGLLSTRAGSHPLRHMEPCPQCLGDSAGQPRMRALGVLLADLADLGYDASWTCVRASDVGAPHRRERVFLTAWPATTPGRAAVEDANGEPRCQRGLSAPGQTQGRRPRAHPGRRDRTPTAHPEGQRRCEGLAEPEARRRQPHPRLHRGEARCARYATRGCCTGRPPVSATHPDLIGRERRLGHNPETQGRHEPAHGGHSPARWWGDYLPAIRRWEHVTQRAAPLPTQPGTRRLSAEFVEWMIGLDGHVTGTPDLSRAVQLRLLGNTVVPHQTTLALTTLVPGWSPHTCPRRGDKP
ncbi:DNA cytosine methyltransferase [Streptomyces malaysiensis]|uniref:DNA cytosine methyltransferase n=1 Tax=Streptomyces malaysiensis TaxID=92644 RepID=UPI002B2CF302|nr:DNA (cytosine-5-)-methyltransferase [Streptomyces malaysiensis]